MLNGSAAGERKGTGRVLATKSQRTFSSATPHSYARLRSTDSAAFDALQKLFPAAESLDRIARPSASLASSTTPSRNSHSSASNDAASEASHPFAFALDLFKGLPAEEADANEEEGGDDVEVEASDDDDDDGSLTRSPFLAPTPSRLSTASSSSSVSARSRRQSAGRPSVSPAKDRSTVSKKLDLTDDDATKEEAPQSAGSRRASRRSGRGSTVSFAADDEDLPSAPSSRRRSGIDQAQESKEAEDADEEREEETKEAPQDEEAAVAQADMDAKYDGDADGDDNADAGEAAMDFDDAGDEAESANGGPHGEDEEAEAGPSPPRAAPRRPRVAGKSRRETTRLVDEAKRVGMLQDDEGEGFGGRRRPKRHRIEPLRYWENEHITYERTQGGVGNVMPVPKDVVRSSYTSPVRKRKAAGRPAIGQKKATKATKRALLKERESSSDADELEDEQTAPFGGSEGDDEELQLEQSAIVHTPNREEVHKVVAKTKKLLPLEYLSQPLSSSSTAPIPLTQLPKGGKAFEEKEFSSGVLVLPPLGKKQHEQTCTVESFVILSAAPRSLQVTIGPQGTAFRLSKGDQFVVPLGNVYSLHNLSATKEVEAHFHLITPKEDVEREVREQLRREESDGRQALSAAQKGGTGRSRGKGEVPVLN